MTNADQAPPQFDLVAAARARRSEISKQRAALDAEDAELEAFLRTAQLLANRLAPTVPAPEPSVARRVSKSEVIDMANRLFREHNGRPITTGEVGRALISSGVQFSGSSVSSIVSAYLGQANDILRNPDGPGWVLRSGSWIEKEINKTL